jgi:hypothetical protein
MIKEKKGGKRGERVIETYVKEKRNNVFLSGGGVEFGCGNQEGKYGGAYPFRRP